MITIPQEFVVYTIIGLIAAVLILIVLIVHLYARVRTLSRGRKGENIEQVFKSFEAELKEHNAFRSEMKTYLTSVEKRLRRSVQGVANVGFNAFQGLDSGGRQSFATAFLNEHGDGVLISTLHARERVNVFAKEIKGFKASVTLSAEEQDALTQAQESCKL